MGQKTSCNLRQVQAAETRSKLLESAQKLFAEKGYKGTSVRMINRSIGLADGILYHYFPGGKKEIFKAVLRDHITQIMDALEDRGKIKEYTRMPLDQVLETAYCNFMDVIDAHEDFIRMMFRENEVREFITKEEMMHFSRERCPWMPSLLRQKMEAGEVREMDFEMAALNMNFILMNHVMAKVVGDGNSKLEDPGWRKRLIDYQVELWMAPQEKKKTDNRKER